MRLGVHYFGYKEYESKKQDILNNNQLDYVFIGNYGCEKKAVPENILLRINEDLQSNGKRLHYISPKISDVQKEKERIVNLLKNNISVSINDWGLYYSLTEFIHDNKVDVYLGRMLTKTISDWLWSPEMFQKENSEAIAYFYQNNFNHTVKINYFLEKGIKGIEVNVNTLLEESYRKITEKGLSVIGYLDEKILAVSRSCPLRRLNNSECSALCEKRLILNSAKDHTDKLTDMQLVGNTVIQNKKNRNEWTGYEILVSSNVGD